MGIATRDLLRLLRKSDMVDEFIVSESRALRHRVSLGPEPRREIELDDHQELTIFVDRREGRGSARFVPELGRPFDESLRMAAQRATLAAGDSWRLQAPSAPARVRVADPQLLAAPQSELELLVERLQQALPKGSTLHHAKLLVERRSQRALLSTGFDSDFESTLLQLSGLFSSVHGQPVRFAFAGRHREQLNVDELIRDAHARSARVPSPVDAQTVDLVLSASAYQASPSKGDYGIWSPLVAQADGERVRAGLARYQPGQPITRRDPQGDALTLRSIAIHPYGLRSAPFAEDGRAVRSIDLVLSNTASGLALSHREGALRKLASNGGVHTLVVGSGIKGVDELSLPTERPVLIAEHISSLRWSPSGSLLIEVADGMLLRPRADGSVSRSAVSHVCVNGNLYDWLEKARFSRERLDTPWAILPQIIRFDEVRLLP